MPAKVISDNIYKREYKWDLKRQYLFFTCNIQFIHLYSILVLVVGNGQTALAVSSIVEMAIQIGSGVE